MASNYLIWTKAIVENAVVLDTVRGVSRYWELSDGISRAGDFPDDASFKMSENWPHNTVLVDNLENKQRVIVASSRLVAFLQARAIPKIEYLPVTILDHKTRPAAGGEYSIVHTIDPVDCLDSEASKVTWDELDEDCIESLEQLVLDESRIDVDRELFRVKHYTNVAIAHRNLATAIDEAGFTGIRWVELDEYSG
jgi:hypothetical protein